MPQPQIFYLLCVGSGHRTVILTYLENFYISFSAFQSMKCDGFHAPYGLNMFVRYRIIKDIRHRASAMATVCVITRDFFLKIDRINIPLYIYIF
jgi:hypothetical protein